MRDKIGSLEALSLLLVVVLNHVILSLPKNVIAKTGSSSLLNIIFVSILAFLFMMFCLGFLVLLKSRYNFTVLAAAVYLSIRFVKSSHASV